MFMDEMIELANSQNIKTLITRLARVKNQITLWQNPKDVERLWKTVHIKRYNLKNNEIQFYPRTGMFNFDVRYPIYFYSIKRTAIFKNSIFFNSKLTLTIKAPDTLLLKNLRVESREDLRLGGESVGLFYGDKYLASRQSWFKASLIDRSLSGFSFKSSLHNILRFKEGDPIDFRFEGMEVFKSGVISSVTTQEVKGQKQKYFRVGVKL